ncbi:thiamine phosphate synthase [Butyrivibrio sp. TB]|uniref:thiamine phosphate synthase n=1 Tax=Butyrivibrio sp. TB TaxID=1520809 RepID=UPI0008BE7467|nr:thiamine phosphate synthase [Butyrivibrio sp. TB]SEQ27758.1 thiamine-phosphate diphosphorylase/hydroxyethylthiazole kinase [Butyrivibrio sp. TB]
MDEAVLNVVCKLKLRTSIVQSFPSILRYEESSTYSASRDMNMKSLIRKHNPQIHIITNNITAEISVNAVLALGAAAIGADSPLEVAEITSSSDALVLNTGTPSIDRYEAFRLAGISANTKNIPIVLDPVGVGASTFRKANIKDLLSKIHVTCIRGNASEIMNLCSVIDNDTSSKSDEVYDIAAVPSNESDDISSTLKSYLKPSRSSQRCSGADLQSMIHSVSGVEDAGLGFSKDAVISISKKLDAIIVISGETVTVVSARDDFYKEYPGGSIFQKQFTGAGCMMSALLGAYLATGRKENITDIDSVESCIRDYESCARKAERRVYGSRNIGTMNYRNTLIDELSLLDKPWRYRFDKSDLNLYAITDRSWILNDNDSCSESSLEDNSCNSNKASKESLYCKSLEEAVEKAILGGATIIQLREKNISDDEYIKRAESIKSVCDKYNIPLIINDNVNVALKVKAAGVHVGQDDTSVSKARSILGKDYIIGATAHNLEEAKIAQTCGADYLGVGAAFGSSTKKDATPLTSLETYKEITSNISIPIVAIGGINDSNMDLLTGSGIAGVAIISGIFSALDIEKQTNILSRKAKEDFLS